VIIDLSGFWLLKDEYGEYACDMPIPGDAHRAISIAEFDVGDLPADAIQFVATKIQRGPSDRSPIRAPAVQGLWLARSATRAIKALD